MRGGMPNVPELAHGIVAADRCWLCYKYMEVVLTFNVSINWERFIVFVL